METRIGEIVFFHDYAGKEKTGKLLCQLPPETRPVDVVDTVEFDIINLNSKEGEKLAAEMNKKTSYLVMYFGKPEISGTGPGYYLSHTQLFWVDWVRALTSFRAYASQC